MVGPRTEEDAIKKIEEKGKKEENPTEGCSILLR